jgi:hypothetical protein
MNPHEIRKSLKKNLGVNAGLTANRHDQEQPDARSFPDDTRRAPAKPPAQPNGMAESDMNKSSWRKAATLHTGAAAKSIGATVRDSLKLGSAAAGGERGPARRSEGDRIEWLRLKTKGEMTERPDQK